MNVVGLKQMYVQHYASQYDCSIYTGSEECCGVCQKTEEDDDVVQQWVQCDGWCARWYHFQCLDLTRVPDVWICSRCRL